jgi:hypothetical protein
MHKAGRAICRTKGRLTLAKSLLGGADLSTSPPIRYVVESEEQLKGLHQVTHMPGLFRPIQYRRFAQAEAIT